MSPRTLPFILIISALLVLGCDDQSSSSDEDMADAEADAGNDVEPDADTDVDANMDTTDHGDADQKQTDADASSLRTVEPVYHISGANWTSYVVDNGEDLFSATGMTCSQDLVRRGEQLCLHGGELRSFALPELSSCEGVTASDSENAFDWTCIDDDEQVRVVSTGLRPEVHLRDLIDFEGDTPAWKGMSVTAVQGDQSYTSATSAWWSNPLIESEDVPLFMVVEEGQIVVVTTESVRGFFLGDHTALTTAPGLLATVTDSMGSVISARSFTWVEGHFDANGTSNGIGTDGSYNVLRDIEVRNVANVGLSSTGRHNTFRDVSIVNAGVMGADLNLNDSRVVNLRIEDTGEECVVLRRFAELGFEVDGLTCLNAGEEGIRVESDDLTIRNALVATSGRQGLVVNGNFCTFDNLHILNPGADFAIELSGSLNSFYDLVILNSKDHALFSSPFNTVDNAFIGLLVAGNANDGVAFNSPSREGHNFISDATIAHSTGFGLEVNSSNTVLRTAIYNNGEAGLLVDLASATYVENLASTDNGETDVDVSDSRPGSQFSGTLIVTDTATSCDPGGTGVDAGLDANCDPVGASDSVAVEGSLSNGFVGLVDSDGSNTTGSTTQTYDDISDWSTFDNRFRGWIRDGQVPADIRGACFPGDTCHVYDFSLTTDSPARNILSPPVDGNDTLTHVWSTNAAVLCDYLPGSTWNGLNCENVFLRNAREIHGDGIGNDNGFCESDEHCLITRNIGAYQGHGQLVEAGSIGTGGTIENVTLFDYENNGF